jgi:hypothetical protein
VRGFADKQIAVPNAAAMLRATHRDRVSAPGA